MKRRRRVVEDAPAVCACECILEFFYFLISVKCEFLQKPKKYWQTMKTETKKLNFV